MLRVTGQYFDIHDENKKDVPHMEAPCEDTTNTMPDSGDLKKGNCLE